MIWLSDNGKSSHRFDRKGLFITDDAWDNIKYAMKGVGTISFQLESRDSICVNDVLVISGLEKNLLFI